jgi:outer membrane lipoprotein carrier protein
VARRLIVLFAFALTPTLQPILAAQTPAKSAPARQPPEALARELQGRYQSIRDFSADFLQSYRAGVLKTRTQERGTVAIKKPGKMRWTYTDPERKELVSDGVRLYWYEAEIKQVVERDVASQASTPDLFLSGRGDIARDFTASYADTSSVQGTVALKLVPRKNEPEYEYLVVALDPGTLQIRGLTTKDHQGGESTLTFSNIKENRGLSDKDFIFRRPSGVKVVTDDGR